MTQGAIRSMTVAQARVVNDTVLDVSVDWLRLQDPIEARCRTRGAIADFTDDCYLGLTRVAFSVRPGEFCFGWLIWRLDSGFQSLGPPETDLRAMRMASRG